MIRYCPLPSVTTVRTFSINTGLVTSTVTPGSTAPDASRTTPAIDAWAWAITGTSATNPTSINATRVNRNIRILQPLPSISHVHPRLESPTVCCLHVHVVVVTAVVLEEGTPRHTLL